MRVLLRIASLQEERERVGERDPIAFRHGPVLGAMLTERGKVFNPNSLGQVYGCEFFESDAEGEAEEDISGFRLCWCGQEFPASWIELIQVHTWCTWLLFSQSSCRRSRRL